MNIKRNIFRYNIKGIFCILLLCICFFLSNIAKISSADSNLLSTSEMNLKVTSAEGRSGDQVSVSIMAESNTGMAAGSIIIEYDPEVMTVENVNPGLLISNVMPTINKDFRTNQIKISWATVYDITGDGEICNITFTINQNVTVGSTSVSLKDVVIVDSHDIIVPFNFQDGIVNILPAINVFDIKSLTYTDLSDIPITTLNDDGSIKATIVVENKLGADQDAVCIIALYDSTHKLKKISFDSKKVGAYGDGTFAAGFALPDKISGCYIKVCLWDSFIGLKSFMESDVFPETEGSI